MKKPAENQDATDKTPVSGGLYGGLLLIAFAGLIDAAYLSYVHLTNQACAGGNGCSAVLATPYAMILGIPVAAIGMGMYLALVVFAVQILRCPEEAPIFEPWLFGISAAGVLVSGYFIAVQAFVIGEWCPFCLLSAALTVCFFLVCLYGCLKTGSLRGVATQTSLIQRGMPMAVAALVLPPLFVVTAAHSLTGENRQTKASEEQIVATIGGRQYTLGDVDEAIRGELQQLEEERYQARKAYLEEQLLMVEGAKQGMNAEELVQKEVVSKIPVDKKEVFQFIQENRTRLPKPINEELMGKIENHLRKQKIPAAKKGYLARLKDRHGFRLDLPLPSRLSISVNPGDGPSTGPVDAPVTVIEYSDFECPYCSKAHQTMKELSRRYPDKIRLVFRHFPLKQHKRAPRAAEFAYCAGQQDRFWHFADVAFANQKNLSDDDLFDYARRSGIADMAGFTQCIESGQGAAAVQKNMDEGKTWGVDSTPSFFINGRFFSGLPKDLEGIIVEELAAAKPDLPKS